MIKRLLQSVVCAVVVLLLLSGVVLAAWQCYFPTAIVDTSGTSRTYYPVSLGFSGQSFIDAGKIAATALDTNMQVASASIQYMVANDRVLTVLPTLPSNGSVRADFYTGYTGPPATTNFPVIVGENGRFETANAAALQLVANFEIELDGYVDTSKVHHPLVYKPGAFLLDVSAAGTITAGALNADSYDVTPGVFAAWTDVDVSNYVPDGASGVLVEISTPNLPKNTGVRMNGSTDDRRTGTWHYWAMVGLDNAEIFEVYLEDNTCDVYLRGYTDDNWVYKTNATDVSLGAAGAWTDVDLTASTEDGAVAAIIEVVNTFAGGREVGLRKNGSSDNRHPDIWTSDHTFRIVGLDDSEIFEGYVETTDVDFYLIGYVKGGATFATDATDKSLGASGAWTDVDCSVEAPAATYLFFEVNTVVGPLYVGFRENGSTDNIVTDVTRDQVQGVVKADMNQVVEAVEEDNTQSSFYLVGYTEYGLYPPFPNPTYLVSSSVGGGALASGVKNIKVTGDGVNFVLDVDGVTDSNAIGAGVTNTTNNWRFMSMVLPYLTDYYHTATGALQITYEPATMLAGSTVVDETNAFDGTIAWGCNQDLTIAYGAMVGYASTSATTGGTAGGFDVPSVPLPSNWFASGGNVSALPFYDSFSAVSAQTGQPVQMLYALAIVGVAFGVFIGIAVFTRSALMAYIAMVAVFGFGASMTVIPAWIVFVMIIVGGGIMYLYRQVAY